jgi:signal peptidase I
METNGQERIPVTIRKPRTGKAVLGAFITAIIMKLFVFDFLIADGSSMMPAIRPGAVLLVNRLAYGLRLPWTGDWLLRWSRPKTGDTVVFYTPLGELAVKRCGRLIEDERFLALGDNSVDSFDSRSYGPVPVDHIIGKVVGIK